MTDITVPLVSRRRERIQFMQKVQHGAPAVVVFYEGLDRIFTGAGDASRWVGTAEAFAGMLVLGALARSIGRLKWGAGHTPPRQRVHLSQVDWVDIVLAGLMFTEVAAHWYDTGHWRRPTILMGAITLATGLLHGRLTAYAAKRRALRITDDGIAVGGKLFRQFTARWSDIARIDLADKTAAIVMRDGRTQPFDFVDLRHGNDVMRALTRARVRLEQAGPADVGSAGQVQPS